ncbi:MAG: triose-phosphate isomerase [Armatimonadetes bacterium]|nr:triose-phosphate isomerase [Armatimonadota bacterium]
MRTPIIAGNWKMHKTVSQALELVEGLKPLVDGVKGVEVVVCPPYTALYPVRQSLAGSEIALGAQDIFWKDSYDAAGKPTGAYTSRVAAEMLVEIGCKYVIIGHSETRGRFGKVEPDMTEDLLKQFGETDASVNIKAKKAFEKGLIPIVCCGETLSEREAGQTDEVVSGQIERALDGLTADRAASIVIAYEPVWAIGTGETCDTPEANRVCSVIRGTVAALFPGSAEKTRIQYGGSVKPDNAAELLSQPDIDGALVGGAALEAKSFAAIVKGAAQG